MGCPHIVWALNEGRVRKLTSTVRLVLMVVAEYANGALICWPSIQTIANDTGLKRRAVQTALRSLERQGLVKIEERPRMTSIYHVMRPIDGDAKEGGDASDAPMSVVHPPVQVVHPHESEQEWPESADFDQFDDEWGGAPNAREGVHLVHTIPLEEERKITPLPPVRQIALFEETQPAAAGEPKASAISEPKPSAQVLQMQGAAADRVAVMAAWNAMAADAGLAKITAMASNRVRHLNARLKEHGIDGVLLAIKSVGESDFCRGKSQRGWKADFDWLLDAVKFERAMNGAYANNRGDRAESAPQQYRWL